MAALEPPKQSAVAQWCPKGSWVEGQETRRLTKVATVGLRRATPQKAQEKPVWRQGAVWPEPPFKTAQSKAKSKAQDGQQEEVALTLEERDRVQELPQCGGDKAE